MFLQQVLQFGFDIHINLGFGPGGGLSCESAGYYCPGSSFTAIAAAFATEGYFIQSDVIHYLLTGDMGLWAPLLYILAAAGGMIGVAIGMPPKSYMWFFLGPAFYHWLLGTPQAVHGTEWQVGTISQDQREVWKLAEVGLINSRIIRRGHYYVSSNAPPMGGPNGDGSVNVAWFFAFYDSMVSNTAQWLIRWTGIYNQDYNADIGIMLGFGPGGFDVQTNIAPMPTESFYNFQVNSQDLVGGVKWHLLSNIKWSLLEDITSASVHTADLRDAFISFMASECGETFSQFVDPGQFAAAQFAKGNNLPLSVLTSNTDGSGQYSALGNALQKMSVPVTPSLQNLIKKKRYFDGMKTPGSNEEGNLINAGSFRYFLSPAAIADLHFTLETSKLIRCSQYFQLVMEGFRWEAGHIFHQMVISKRPTVLPEEIVYSLFYGWDIKTCSGGGECTDDQKTALLNAQQQFRYLQNLVLVYLIRNEMRLSPKIFTNPRYAGSTQVENYTKTHLRSVGEKTKYGEVYTWATLVPYVQGVLLYILAMGYPFACILVVVPGWHKTIFTWMSFWAWAKLWDVGFAVVQTIERSVWAMMGNSSDAKRISSRIVDIQTWGNNIDITCPAGNLAYNSENFSCVIPHVCSIQCEGQFSAAVADPNVLIKIFDRALVLSSNLDLDLTNSYYVYIMAALYMAVPAVTGQLVLGAKAGMSGLVNTMIGGAASEAGRAAGAGFSSDMTQKAKSAGAALGQTAYLAGMRGAKDSKGRSLIGSALAAGNLGAELNAAGNLLGGAREASSQKISALGQKYGLEAAKLGTANADIDRYTRAPRAKIGPTSSALQAAGAVGGAFGSVPGGDPKGRGGGGSVSQFANASSSAGNAISSVADVGSTLREGETLGVRQNLARDQYVNSKNQSDAFTGAFREQSAASFGAGLGAAQGVGYQLAQSRLGAEAHFVGENAAWVAKNNLANELSGELGAMGVNSGVLDPGPKPIHFEGAAMTGMLDGGDGSNDRLNSSMAHFADDAESPFFKNLNESADRLRAHVGEKVIDSIAASAGDMSGYPGFAEWQKFVKDHKDGLNYINPKDAYALNAAENERGIGDAKIEPRYVTEADPSGSEKKDAYQMWDEVTKREHSNDWYQDFLPKEKK